MTDEAKVGIRSKSGGREEEMPQIYAATDYTPGHAATCYVDTPADPLTEGTAVPNPCEFVRPPLGIGL